ncbi:MAG: hypothetical protein KC776_01540 [Myxococcales bacterium]|nr:hypothetical protein [Myxococcales bacterium]MCB9583298.1 hypothetical protein [Polyangiaceae bacterium]
MKGILGLLPFAAAGCLAACTVFSSLDDLKGDPNDPGGGGSSDGGFAAAAGTAGVAANAGDSGSDADSGEDPDAASTECAALGKQCLPGAPQGWLGPVALNVATGAPAACAGDYPTSALATDVVHGDLDAGTSSCSCACDPPTGATCSSASVGGYGNGVCTTPVTGQIWTVKDGECFSLPAICVSTNVRATSTLSAGPCTPKPAHTLPTPSWATEARACQTSSTAGLCGSGETCLPSKPSGSSMCIYVLGDTACPTTGYSEKHLFYTGVSDSRECSACSCGTPKGGCSAGTLSFYNNGAGCMGVPSSTTSMASCGSHGFCSMKYAAAKPSVSCTPSASTLSGSVSATGAQTFCCMP